MPHKISIMGPIGESGIFFDAISAQEVAAAFAALPDDGEPLVISPYMSRGGLVSHGEAIRQIIEDAAREREVTVEVYGAADSIAAHAVIGARGARILMTRGAQFGIHSPYVFVIGGSAVELESWADGLRKTAAAIAAEIVHRAPTIDEEELVRQLTERGQNAMMWVGTEEAIAVGLADGIVGDPDPEVEAAAAQMLTDVEQVEQAEEEEPEAMAAAGKQKKPTGKEAAMALPKKTPAQPAPVAAVASAATESPPEQAPTWVGQLASSLTASFASLLGRNGEGEPEGPPRGRPPAPPRPIDGAQASMPLQPASQAANPAALAEKYARTGAEAYAEATMHRLTHLSALTLNGPEGSPRDGLVAAQMDVIKAEAANDAAALRSATIVRDTLVRGLEAEHDSNLQAAQGLTTSSAGSAPVASGDDVGGNQLLAETAAGLRQIRPQIAESLARRAAAGDPNYVQFQGVMKEAT